MPTETRHTTSPFGLTRSFNEAVGSCPRKRPGRPRGASRHIASMRPWARAHGNSGRQLGAVEQVIASMRPWARAHGNPAGLSDVTTFGAASMRPWARAHGNEHELAFPAYYNGLQ